MSKTSLSARLRSSPRASSAKYFHDAQFAREVRVIRCAIFIAVREAAWNQLFHVDEFQMHCLNFDTQRAIIVRPTKNFSSAQEKNR